MILHGGNILLLQDGAAIAAAKSCDLDIQCESLPVASPSSGAWADAIPGRKSWSAACSHLVTSITNPLSIVGAVVTLRLQLAGKIGLPFETTVNGVTAYAGSSLVMVDAIVWDSTLKKFLGEVWIPRVESEYYEVWGGSDTGQLAPSTSYNGNAAVGKYFYNYISDNKVYKRTATDLVPEALQGSAIVRGWKITATKGNLAAGQFNFEGKGALAIPTT